MEYITLKNSDLRVSRLCMGGCPMGRYGWGHVDENELLDAVHTALDKGISFFDTADTYGLGESEKTLGKALGAHRKEVIIATKFGVRTGNGKTIYDNSPKWIRQALEDSLNRLQTDYIDLYQIHYRNHETPLNDIVETLEDLQKKGYIRYFGVSNIYGENMDEFEPYIGKFVSCQNEYSLACRKHEKAMFKLHQKLQMNLLTWGSLGQGILTGKYDENVSFGLDDRRSREIYVNFHGEKLKKNLEIVEVLKELAAKYEKPVSAVAIRYILDYLPESVVLCGIKRPEQVIHNVASMGWKLEEEDIKMLEKVSR